jgi:geranylgeranyl pyrophosphate synthase
MSAGPASPPSPDRLVVAEGFDEPLGRLKQFLAVWIDGSDREIRPVLQWQFLGRSKYFRPATLFACHQAVSDRPIDDAVVRAAAAVEMAHNVSLIVDDILDRSRFRRGVLTVHCRFGQLRALMAAGYVTAAAYELVAADGFAVRRLAELFKRLAVAESLQWRLRRQPLGVEDWRHLAGEDTGTMFETCACLGTRDERLRHFGRLLGIVYHGCDDVGDVRGAVGLGGGGEQDIRDGILTLPAALAIRDPEAALEFRDPSPGGLAVLLRHMESALPAAEDYLDRVAADAEAEAVRVAPRPDGLLRLVRNTRRLSR